MKALFHLQHLYYLPQFLPVMLTLREQGWATIEVSLSQRVSKAEFDIFRAECKRHDFPVITASSETQRQAELRRLNYDLIFVGNKTDLAAIVTSRARVIMIYHGIGLKQSYYTDIHSRIDVLVVESPDRLSVLENLSCRKVLAGFTKLDPLAWEKKQSAAILTLPPDMEPEPGLPTILYAPTFYPSSVERVIPRLATFSLAANILVKLHQFSWTKRKYRHHIRLARKAAEKNPRLKLLPYSCYNILPAYHHSDLLVTDISSTLFEYLAVGKPIIQTELFTPRFKHRLFPFLLEKRLDHQRFNAVDFVYSCRNSESLEAECTRRLAGDDPLAEKRKEAVGTYLYRLDGKASERLLTDVKSMVSSV
ncbi:MAG: CDP-glycerol glycerophosphotransferase family protein [Fidelibacterota bacterium]